MFTPLLVAALAVSAPIPKAAAPELKWKFTKGDTFYVTSEIESSTTVTGGGGIGAQANTSVTVFVYKATVTAADGKETTVELDFLSAKHGMGVGGAAAKLDDSPGVAGKKVTVTLDKAHKVTKAVGADELAKGGAAISGILGDDYLRHNIEDLFRAVPGKALGKGETWTGEVEHPLADGITYKRTDSGSVTGTEEGLTKLEVETDNAMSGGPKAGGITFDLKGDKGKRTVLFDGKAGRVRKLEEKYAVGGTIGIVGIGGAGGGGGGAPQNIQVGMEMKGKITVSDTEPKSEK